MRYSYIKSLEKLTDYAIKQGFKEISFDHVGSSYIDWAVTNEPDKIKIEGKHNNEFKTYLMLHELGHHILRKDWEKYNKILPTIAYAESKYETKFRRRTSYIVSLIEEEYAAWSQAFKLATKLGIHVNPIKWDKLKTKCLMAYIRHYGVNSKNSVKIIL